MIVENISVAFTGPSPDLSLPGCSTGSSRPEETKQATGLSWLGLGGKMQRLLTFVCACGKRPRVEPAVLAEHALGKWCPEGATPEIRSLWVSYCHTHAQMEASGVNRIFRAAQHGFPVTKEDVLWIAKYMLSASVVGKTEERRWQEMKLGELKLSFDNI